MAIQFQISGETEGLSYQSLGQKAAIGSTFKFADQFHPLIPESSEYVFRRNPLRRLLAFLETPEQAALWIYGKPGTGKTSIVRQLAARMNWPLTETTMNTRRELEELLAYYEANDDGQLDYLPGPLSKAMMEGHIFLCNEISLMDPGELAGLNEMITDGFKLKNGLIVKPHANFRFIATDNTCGRGSEGNEFSGTAVMNSAFVDRFEMLKMDEPTKDEELQMLMIAVDAAAETYGITVDKAGIVKQLESMVTVADAVRKAYEASVTGYNSDAGIGVDMTFRTLTRWVQKSLRFSMAPSPLKYGLEAAYLDKLQPAETIAVNAICQDVFGDLWSH